MDNIREESQTAKTTKTRHGNDFYSRIGTIGGSKKGPKGFAVDRELAKEAGRRGGLKSRRGKVQSHNQ